MTGHAIDRTLVGHTLAGAAMTPCGAASAASVSLALSNAASPVIAATMCGRTPKVQPNAATALARAPRDMPATVNKTPVPGVATITSVVNKNATLTFSSQPNHPR